VSQSGWKKVKPPSSCVSSKGGDGGTHVIGTCCHIGLLHWIRWVLCLSKKGDEGTCVVAALGCCIGNLELMGVLFRAREGMGVTE